MIITKIVHRTGFGFSTIEFGDGRSVDISSVMVRGSGPGDPLSGTHFKVGDDYPLPEPLTSLKNILNPPEMTDTVLKEESCEQIDATDHAFKLAEDNAVSLLDVNPTGKDGKVTVNDVRKFMRNR